MQFQIKFGAEVSTLVENPNCGSFVLLTFDNTETVTEFVNSPKSDHWPSGTFESNSTKLISSGYYHLNCDFP